MMTWKIVVLMGFVLGCFSSAAPFINVNEVHQSYSEFEVNLILNENRNYPVLIVAVSVDESKQAARDILEQTMKTQSDATFALIIDCREFMWDLNHTLGLCRNYKQNETIPEGTDPNFFCQFMFPQPTRIKEKGHIVTKSHGVQVLGEGKNFNSEYLGEMIKNHISDLIHYIEDKYDLDDFLQFNSDFKVSKLPKLLYFDENLLAPMFLRKIAAIMDGRIEVGVSDDTDIARKYGGQFDGFLMFQFDFESGKYTHNVVEFNIDNPIQSLKEQDEISQYLNMKKSRDMVLDFEHRNYTIYNFTTMYQVSNLIAHGRLVVIELSTESDSFNCNQIYHLANQHSTLLNYVCFSRLNRAAIDSVVKQSLNDDTFLLVLDSVSKSIMLPKVNPNLYNHIPQTQSRQKVSTDTEAQMCLRTASISNRDPIFYYFNEKSHKNELYIMNYLNSLPEVTSLLYFCHIYLPDDDLIHKFTLKPNTIFTLFDEDGKGTMQKLQHTKISSFLEIKMFLREVSIKKMLKVYEQRLLNKKIVQIKTAEDLTEHCFNSKCIIALIATGKYRQDVQMKMMEEVKLEFIQQGFKFFWIDGVCHWDVAKQLKILKKKEKSIEKSYIFYYNEKNTDYSLWKTNKFWDKKELFRWIKSLRNKQNIGSLRYGIDIELTTCEQPKKVLEEF